MKGEEGSLGIRRHEFGLRGFRDLDEGKRYPGGDVQRCQLFLYSKLPTYHPHGVEERNRNDD